MITLRDSLQLAYTKIRTRRIRLFVVLFVSSLLFSGLVAGSLIVSGALQSFTSFSDEGFSGRYIVAGTYADSKLFTGGLDNNDPAMIARAEALEKDLEVRKKAEAKRLGIEYVSTDTERTVYQDESGNKSLNYQTKIGEQVVSEFDAANPHQLNMGRFRQQVSGANAYYESKRISQFGGTDRPTLSLIKDGKEETIQRNTGNMARGLEGLKSDWTLIDPALLRPFLLPGQTLAMGDDGSIPIVASYSAAQEILQLPALSATATPQQKKERLSEVRQRIAGQTFSMCYRNYTSYGEFQSAVQQQADIKANEGKKDYQKPERITAPSTEACAAPVVQRDVRTAQEKQLAAKQLEFERTFGAAEPVSQLLTYRIVGLTSDRAMPSTLSVNDILSSVLSSSIGVSWASPLSVEKAVPVTKDIFKTSALGEIYSPSETYYAEYDNAEAARTMLKHGGCVIASPGVQLQADQISCSRETRPFYLQPFGSASLAIDEFQSGFRKVQLIAAAVIGVIAAVILMGMIGRIIADARKETAVFRALGASRLAIAQIYIVYTLYLGILTVLIALAIGFGIALFVDSKLSPDASISMALLFNSSDLSRQFHFYGLDILDVGVIAAAIIGAALVGSFIPIAHNIQRNPIKDMRED